MAAATAGWVLVALLLALCWRLDRYRASSMVVLTGSVTAIIAGAMAMWGEDPHPLAAALALVSISAVGIVGTWLFRTQFGEELLWDPLTRRFGRAALTENDGVQFVLFVRGMEKSGAAAGGYGVLRVPVGTDRDARGRHVLDARSRCGSPICWGNLLLLPALGRNAR